MPTVQPMVEQCHSNWAKWKQLAEERKIEKEKEEMEKKEREEENKWLINFIFVNFFTTISM